MKPFKWLLNSPHLRLKTKMSPAEFTETFIRCVGRPRYIPTAGYWGSSRILGTLNGTSFKLQERCWYRNSGLPYFYGKFRSDASGSEITGYFSLDPFVQAVMVLIFWIALMLSTTLCLTALSYWVHGSLDAAWGFLAALGTTAILLLAVVHMGVIGKKKEEMYLKFFSETFDAFLVDRRD